MFFRMQLGGHLGPAEVFTLNFVFDVEGEIDEGWDQTTANAMAEAGAATVIPAGLLSLIRSADGFDSFRIEGRRDADDSLIGVAEAPMDVNGPTSSGSLPPQSAVVLSLRTDNPGASGRGRLYWPATAASLTTAMRLGTPAPENVVAAAATYFSSLETNIEAAIPGLPFWSSLNFAVRSTSTRTTPHVRRIMVGDVIDTQRRRRDGLPEAYQVAQYPPAA